MKLGCPQCTSAEFESLRPVWILQRTRTHQYYRVGQYDAMSGRYLLFMLYDQDKEIYCDTYHKDGRKQAIPRADYVVNRAWLSATDERQMEEIL